MMIMASDDHGVQSPFALADDVRGGSASSVNKHCDAKISHAAAAIRLGAGIATKCQRE